jgi:1,2-diacylglycerol-3-alpha-glucose alpha-1,2-galactosyltransferase
VQVAVNVVAESAFTVSGHGVHSAYLEDLALLRRLPDVRLTTNRPIRTDIQHLHTVGPYAVATQRLGVRNVVTAHLTPASLANSLRGHRTWHEPFLRHLRAVYNRADTVLALCPGDVDVLAEFGVTAPIRLLPNSIDAAAIRSGMPSRAAARQRLGIAPDQPLVVGVGQVQPRKGIRTFLTCARDVPQAAFRWIGGMIFGPLAARRGEMRRLVRGAPPNTRFVGAHPRPAVFEYLAAADLFFLPSHHESCPMAVLEAASAGVPIVLRDLPRYRNLFGAGFQYGTDETFTDIVRACLTDRDLRLSLAQGASRVADRFDSALRARELTAVYRSLSGLPRATADGWPWAMLGALSRDE